MTEAQRRAWVLVGAIAILTIFTISSFNAWPEDQFLARILRITTVTLLGSFLLYGCLFLFPKALIGNVQLDGAQRLTVETSIQTMLLQAVGGGILLLGAVFAFEQLRAATKQVEISRQATANDRFSNAVDQLASPAIEVRISGITALGSFSRDPQIDQRLIYSLLSYYVRHHSPLQPTKDRSKEEQLARRYQGIASLSLRTPDVQAALTSLGRNPAILNDGSRFRVGLRDTDLRGALLGHANLSEGDFRGARLDDTSCWSAFPPYTNLAQADFRGASLRNVRFYGADLSRSHLEGADLTGARLDDADLRGAIADSSTKWPVGFEPTSHGVQILG